MEQEHKVAPFTQYLLSRYHSQLRLLPQGGDKERVQALILGAVCRNQRKLYKGDKSYHQDLQTILDHDRELAPLLLKEHKIITNRDGNMVLNQCIDCGKYMPPFKHCPKCQHVHYCSQACEMRSKLGHQAVCKPRQLPSVDAALQVQVHIGGDLGKEVQVYYQHQLRTSLKLRGEQFISGLFDYFTGQGKMQLPENCRPEIINSHLKMRLTGEQSNPTSSGQSLVPDTLDQVSQLYCSNPMVGKIIIQILQKGGVMTHLIRQVHNNHLHLIYIFLCS